MLEALAAIGVPADRVTAVPPGLEAALARAMTSPDDADAQEGGGL
jgi:hypothetical protein